MGKNNGNGNTNAGSSYVGAPYNFVPFAKEPYALNGDSQVPHDVLDTERFDGEIRYRVTAKTPIFVSDGFKDKDGKVKADFARNQYGEYAIPGNTMRGLVRNNLQILSESSFNEDVDDYRMMFREVAGGSDRIDRKRYAKILGAGIKNLGNGKQVSILKWVKAGYLVKENGKYFIYGTVNDTDAVSDDKLNYYIISEREIINQCVDNGYKYDDFSFFFDNPETYLQHKTMKKFKKIGEGKRAKYVNDENNEYIPYMVPVAYKASSNGKVLSVKALSEEIGEDYVKGYALSSGPMKNKKVIYIIPEINREGKCIDIQATDPNAIKAFRIDYEKRKNGLKPVKAYKDKKTKDALMQKYYDLPDESQIKPVFYIEHEGLYFGYTPRLRLFNDYSIKGGMSDDQKKYIFDHSKSLFGYSNDKGSYKSRLSFSDAVITKEGTKPRQRIGVILAEPKPSSFADYLVQDGETIKYTYNSDKFELRGIKQYWLHDKPVTPPASDKEAVKSTLYPLSDGTEFEGVVRFSNLDKTKSFFLIQILHFTFLRIESFAYSPEVFVTSPVSAITPISVISPVGTSLISISALSRATFILRTRCLYMTLNRLYHSISYLPRFSHYSLHILKRSTVSVIPVVHAHIFSKTLMRYNCRILHENKCTNRWITVNLCTQTVLQSLLIITDQFISIQACLIIRI